MNIGDAVFLTVKKFACARGTILDFCALSFALSVFPSTGGNTRRGTKVELCCAKFTQIWPGGVAMFANISGASSAAWFLLPLLSRLL